MIASRMPWEIQDQIIRSTPLTEMPNVVRVSRAFHRHAIPHFYRSVYYLVGSTQPTRHNFPLLRCRTRACYPECSTRIVRLRKFLRTIIENPMLQSCIDEVGFSVVGSGDEGEIEVLNDCLSILRPSTLHLALSNENADLALASTVTSLDIEYPAEKDLDDLEDSLRDHVYSLFSIPSLRHLALRGAKRWDAFSPIPDNTRSRTSNVVSLFLPHTVPMDYDLQEILTWPKGLQYIFHQNQVGEQGFFQNIFRVEGSGEIASPEVFLQGIASQRESLQEVSYNNVEDCCGTDGSTFDPALVSEFTQLRTLSVPFSCLMGDYGEPHHLYTVLPPNLEEFYLNYGINIGDAQQEAELRGWLQEVVDHKEAYFSSLKTIVLWQWEGRLRDRTTLAIVHALFDRISLGPALKKANIRLEFVFRPQTGVWDSNMLR